MVKIQKGIIKAQPRKEQRGSRSQAVATVVSSASRKALLGACVVSARCAGARLMIERPGHVLQCTRRRRTRRTMKKRKSERKRKREREREREMERDKREKREKKERANREQKKDRDRKTSKPSERKRRRDFSTHRWALALGRGALLLSPAEEDVRGSGEGGLGQACHSLRTPSSKWGSTMMSVVVVYKRSQVKMGWGVWV